MAFRGWPEEAIDFFEGLEADNSRTYWNAHKAVYDDAVRRPMVELLAELAPEFGEGRIFRPHRDVRFSADKSPYKTAIGATLAGGGYVQLSAQGLAAACGVYEMGPDQLERYRRAVVEERSGGELETIVARARHAGLEVTGREVLKTAPRGYPRDHPRVALLRHKGLVTWKQWPVGPWLGTRAAKNRVVELLRASAPLNEWLLAHVGPALDLPEQGR